MTTAADIWAYAATGATLAAAALRADELHAVHGLDAPLQVSDSARVAGTIQQAVSDIAGTVTVERLP